MKKFVIVCAAVSAILVSCGPDADEMNKMKEQAGKTFDSLDKLADKKIKEDLRIQDSVNEAQKNWRDSIAPKLK
jgi:hypothetical protein